MSLSFPIYRMRTWITCFLSPHPAPCSCPMPLWWPEKFIPLGNCQKYLLCLWDELQNLLLAGLWPGACPVYNEECFSPCKSRQCSLCLLRWEVGLVGMYDAAGTLTPLEPLHLFSYEVVCLICRLPDFPCPFIATFVQGYCHLLFLSLAYLQVKYLGRRAVTWRCGDMGGGSGEPQQGCALIGEVRVVPSAGSGW